MEIEAQKMEATNKACAEVLLNTAHEAAARILKSEHKSLVFQKELSFFREESLGTMIRMKKVMDSKLAEAETKSTGMQKKLDEVEAQLHEAEQIIVDLRYELTEVQDELEKLKKRQPIINAHHVEKNVSCYEQEAHDLDSMKIARCPQNIPKSCNADLSSVIMGRKMPELFRNSCTQRIQAFESATLNAKLPPSRDEDASTLPSHKVECVDLISEPESDTPVQNKDKLCKSPLTKVNRRRKRKILFGKAKKNSPKITEASKIVPRGYMKRNVKYRNTLSTSYKSPPGNLVEHDQPMFSRCKRGVQYGNADVESDEEMTENENSIVQIASELQNSRLVNLQTTDGTAPEANNGDYNQGDDDLILKYRVNRKRKNSSLTNPDSFGDSTKRRAGKKQSSARELPKSSLADEPSRDDRRLKQVARQLISLSGKKWS